MYFLSINTNAYNIGLLINKFQRTTGKNIKRKLKTFDFAGMQKGVNKLFKSSPRYELSIPWSC